jgi:hypothetical protein
VNILFNDVEEILLRSKTDTISFNSLKKKAGVNEMRNALDPLIRVKKTSSSISQEMNPPMLERTKSLLSVVDNPELNNNMNKILSLMEKMFEQLKHEMAEEKISQKICLIKKLLEAVKILSINNDNHLPILIVKSLILSRER